MTTNVRRAAAADLDALTPLFDAYRGFYGQPSDLARARAYLDERLARDEAVVFLAEADGQPAGFTLLYPMFSSVSTARVFILNDLFVAGEHRREGIGQALLAAARDFARSQGARRLMLETARDNHPAQALYRRAGWHADETQWFHLSLDAEPT